MRIISIHNGNVDPDIIKYQKLVFDYLGLPLEQIETPLQHAEALDYELTKPFDQIAIFDIDCIPLNRSIIASHASIMCSYGYLFGAAQQANHINGSEIYVGPFFVCFDQRLFNSLGRPSFQSTDKGDVGHQLTLAANKINMQIRYLWPTHVEQPMWNLGISSSFGLGTTYGGEDYENEIYHAFQSRMGNGERFINKCKEVLDGKYK